jgi:hypothetical protein
VSTVEEVRAAEANLNIEKLVQMGLDQVEIQAFEFPESVGPDHAGGSRIDTEGDEAGSGEREGERGGV